ncbi:SET domain-containing protein [Mycena polygramma]|nr:SET domain-containing protein [Mycena polygramma]
MRRRPGCPRPLGLLCRRTRLHRARESVKSLRLQTETIWSEIAANCNGTEPGAAGITFVNDIDDEEIPKSLHDGAFQYLEDKYFPSPTLPFPVDPDENAAAPFVADPTSFQFCGPECECEDLRHCCQDTEYVNGYAYTDGLFNFKYTFNEVVVECNPYCLCPPTCGNRVTQQPRRVPIEVFKTARCGWGVRLPVDVVRGTVLGVYTGKLIPRKEAESLTGEAKQYCFDLDYDEEGATEDELYTVDSLDYGNWTRFINHSCAPNLLVQPVVHNTLPAQRIAFLTFIATKDISSGTELTFDYDPEAQIKFVNDVRERGEARARHPSRRPRGANECMCGAERCRGWVRTWS